MKTFQMFAGVDAAAPLAGCATTAKAVCDTLIVHCAKKRLDEYSAR